MIAPGPLFCMMLLTAAPSSLADLRWEKRILVVSASSDHDAMLREQRNIVGAWRDGAKDRDLTVVEVVGDRVVDASDAAGAVRRRYKLPLNGFAVALIGKDGGVKLRRRQPISAATLEEIIDAMPMRREGGR